MFREAAKFLVRQFQVPCLWFIGRILALTSMEGKLVERLLISYISSHPMALFDLRYGVAVQHRSIDRTVIWFDFVPFCSFLPSLSWRLAPLGYLTETETHFTSFVSVWIWLVADSVRIIFSPGERGFRRDKSPASRGSTLAGSLLGTEEMAFWAALSSSNELFEQSRLRALTYVARALLMSTKESLTQPTNERIGTTFQVFLRRASFLYSREQSTLDKIFEMPSNELCRAQAKGNKKQLVTESALAKLS